MIMMMRDVSNNYGKTSDTILTNLSQLYLVYDAVTSSLMCSDSSNRLCNRISFPVSLLVSKHVIPICTIFTLLLTRKKEEARFNIIIFSLVPLEGGNNCVIIISVTFLER